MMPSSDVSWQWTTPDTASSAYFKRSGWAISSYNEMAVDSALTVIEIVVITISVVFVFTRLTVRAVEDETIEENARELFESLLYVDLALIGCTMAAGIHVVSNSGRDLTIAIGLLMIAITVLGYASLISIVEISEQLDAGIIPNLDQFDEE